MHLKITGRHIEITSSIQQAAEDAFSKLNEHCPAISQSLTFEQNSGKFYVHASYKPEHGIVMNASSTESDLYHAIKQVASKLERQISHVKGASKSKRHKATNLEATNDSDEALLEEAS